MPRNPPDDDPRPVPERQGPPAQLDLFGASSARAPAYRERAASPPALRAEVPAGRAPTQDMPLLAPVFRPDHVGRTSAPMVRAEAPIGNAEVPAVAVVLPEAPIARDHAPGWTSMTIATATIVLLFANAGTLAAWVDEMAPTPMQQQLAGLTSGWAGAMDRVGVTGPRAKLHEQWKKLQALRFGQEAPGETQ